MIDTPTWCQLDVSLSRSANNARPHARAVFAALMPNLETWRAARMLSCFHFSRKPPDLRLRFAGPNPTGALESAAAGVLDQLERDGHIVAYARGLYEPEVRKFGGPVAMELVHRLFDEDTITWLSLERLREAGLARLSEEGAAAVLVDDLFRRVLPDDTERWDAWANLADLLPAAPAAAEPAVTSLTATKAEWAALRRCAEAVSAFADGLRQLVTKGQLRVGRRALVPHVAMAIFNRHGLDGARQAVLARTAVESLDPHARLRGASPDAAV